jgi:uncharacterized protein YggE
MRIPLLAAALALCVLGASGRPASAAEARSVTVTGQGTTMARPDMAVLTAGVVSEAATATEALAANSRSTAAVIDQLKAGGIEAADLQTSGFSLQPVYAYPQQQDGSNPQPPRITGYSVTNTVSVRVRDLARLGSVMDAAVSAGANSVNGVTFLVSRESELLDRARQDAVADARRKAALYASAAGARLGAVTTLTEQVTQAPPRPMYRMRADAAAASVPVEAGESELRIEIAVTFALE